MAVIAARAGIHRGNQLEIGWKSNVHCSTGNMDFAALQRLAQGFKGFAVEFGQFVQEQHAFIGQRNGTRPHIDAHAAAYQRHQAGRMVRRQKRASAAWIMGITRQQRLQFPHFDLFGIG